MIKNNSNLDFNSNSNSGSKNIEKDNLNAIDKKFINKIKIELNKFIKKEEVQEEGEKNTQKKIEEKENLTNEEFEKLQKLEEFKKSLSKKEESFHNEEEEKKEKEKDKEKERINLTKKVINTEKIMRFINDNDYFNKINSLIENIQSINGENIDFENDKIINNENENEEHNINNNNNNDKENSLNILNSLKFHSKSISNLDDDIHNEFNNNYIKEFCFNCKSSKDKLVKIDKNFLNYLLLISTIILDEISKHMEKNSTKLLNYKLEVIQKNSDDLKFMQNYFLDRFSNNENDINNSNNNNNINILDFFTRENSSICNDCIELYLFKTNGVRILFESMNINFDDILNQNQKSIDNNYQNYNNDSNNDNNFYNKYNNIFDGNLFYYILFFLKIFNLFKKS